MDSASEQQRFDLPERLDSTFARDLYDQIDAHKGSDLSVNGESVVKIGGLCLQVLLSAQDEWRRHDHAFHIHTPSETLSDLMTAIGREDILNAETPCP